MASSTTQQHSEAPALAGRAATARANALCDEIDRRRHALIELGDELEGAIAVCRALLTEGGDGCHLQAVLRAERIREQIPG